MKRITTKLAAPLLVGALALMGAACDDNGVDDVDVENPIEDDTPPAETEPPTTDET